MKYLILILCLVMGCGNAEESDLSEAFKDSTTVKDAYVYVLLKEAERKAERVRVVKEKCKDTPGLAEYVLVLEELAGSIGNSLQCPAYIAYVNWRDNGITDVNELNKLFEEAKSWEACK